MFGFLNVYKPKGKTSHDVVAVLRRITKIKQIGHTGTLDPFAEGVLPICIGKSTRLIEYLDDDKAYIGTVKLGQATSTYDIEGEITKVSDKKVCYEEISSVLKNFCGEIKQLPPIYSAIKVNGKKLYQYAREGKEVKITPRTICISKLEVLNFDENNQIIDLYIECSKGTYIRSLANDLAVAAGTYGHLIKLIRTKVGKFFVENSVKLEDLESLEKIELNLHNPMDYLDYQVYELDKDEITLVSNGMQIQAKESLNSGITILMYEQKIAGIGRCDGSVLKCEKVFHN
ncbi:MAG: tRNA pseudouridine(55) synthase TruB [bacterium]|nr:tRNA pseudouridine(55) synthase TruB [bacterium]